jgi:hypothetical protein
MRPNSPNFVICVSVDRKTAHFATIWAIRLQQKDDTGPGIAPFCGRSEPSLLCPKPQDLIAPTVWRRQSVIPAWILRGRESVADVHSLEEMLVARATSWSKRRELNGRHRSSQHVRGMKWSRALKNSASVLPLEVDGRFRAEFAAKEGTLTGAQEPKQSFSCFRSEFMMFYKGQTRSAFARVPSGPLFASKDAVGPGSAAGNAMRRSRVGCRAPRHFSQPAALLG